MRHANAAVFVPHNGCPHRCSFCNQNTITGSAAQLGPDDVRAAAERAAQTLPPGVPAEFAFFGGSFTAIGRERMLSLLGAVQPYLRAGVFSGIRCSTRPDCVDAEILSLLKDLVRIGIESEIYTYKMNLLDTARKQTTQKVNLYEKVQIPGYNEAIRKIKRFLEDEDNLAKSAQKIVKRRHEQEAGL